jgi:6-phosphofructokinase 1
MKIAVMHVGACAPGMNAAVRATVRIGLINGHTMVGVKNGFEGLLSDDIINMDWMSVNGWARQGGAFLGVRRQVPSKVSTAAVVAALEKHKIEAIIMIGGWDGYDTFVHINKHREEFPLLKKTPIVSFMFLTIIVVLTCSDTHTCKYLK